MIQECSAVHSVEEIASNIFQLSFRSPSISRDVKPGQFVNVKVGNGIVPLLRRPFSIFSAEGNILSIIFNVVGLGTKLLSEKKPGEDLDVLGPLGSGVFPLDDASYETALLVAGGLGVAPLPFLTSRVPTAKKIYSFIGARTSAQLVKKGLRNIQSATDDGSEGIHGTVVTLLQSFTAQHRIESPRIYACGPTPMMRAVKEFAFEHKIPCFFALECEMACGIGLCQGCPVEMTNSGKKFSLVCKDGPVFEASTVSF
ncbi:MAG TPA: dihydroorotate dehydrogenase electron transfer subunit [Bacteroidota bacterium]|nr:dihydroorotate dehydrogenase electron transfer subunit [Bacteroidota bacterium]